LLYIDIDDLVIPKIKIKNLPNGDLKKGNNWPTLGHTNKQFKIGNTTY
jgi:hypothetical protein